MILRGSLTTGAEVNRQRWTDGWTPLHLAAMMGLVEVAVMLLQVIYPCDQDHHYDQDYHPHNLHPHDNYRHSFRQERTQHYRTKMGNQLQG